MNVFYAGLYGLKKSHDKLIWFTKDISLLFFFISGYIPNNISCHLPGHCDENNGLTGVSQSWHNDPTAKSLLNPLNCLQLLVYVETLSFLASVVNLGCLLCHFESSWVTLIKSRPSLLYKSQVCGHFIHLISYCEENIHESVCRATLKRLCVLSAALTLDGTIL